MSEPLFPIPESWVWATVQDSIVDAQPGFASGKKNVPGGIKHLRMNNISSECTLDLSSVRTVPRELAKAAYILKPGDVLFCHTNSQKLVGKTAMFDRTDGPYAFSNHLTRLRIPESSVPPEWIWCWLATIWREGYFESRCKQWVNQATVERKTLLSAPIPIAPLHEQMRIVSHLRELRRINLIAKTSLEKVPQLLARLRQTFLAGAITGKLTERNPVDEPASFFLKRIGEEQRKRWNSSVRAEEKELRRHENKRPETTETEALPTLPGGWAWTNIGALIYDAGYGTSRKCNNDSGGTPVLRIPNIVKGILDFRDLKYSKFDGDEIGRLRLERGDLLVCRTNGSLDLVGKSAVVDRLDDTFLFASYLIRLRPAISEVLPAYLNLVLASFIGRKTIESKTRSTAGQYNINLEMLRSIPVPLPPFEEMNRILTKIGEQFSTLEEARRAVSTGHNRAAMFERSMLSNAFRGKLLVQDPKDEPASVLLGRIKANRFVAVRKKNHRVSGSQ
ncbi:MAG TPA: restriction endonuclease subunit S [Candidatus Bathyarchaeia archaeon]|nr:restriction endonuclease subunit S [Candidatus Bathyarchaeia archaeon]